MNIFWLDEDHETAAKYYCDKHVTKINVEINQLISTALRDNGYDWDFLYKTTHVNHPLSKWVGETDANFIETVEHAHALAVENVHRFGKEHTSHVKICQNIAGREFDFGGGGLTERPQAMPDEHKVPGDHVEAYRQYYIHEKNWGLQWTNRDVPDFYADALPVAEW